MTLIKKLNIVFTLLFLVAATPALAEQSPASARNVLEHYLNAVLDGNYKQAYEYIASTDKKKRSRARYLQENQKKPTPLNRVLSDKAGFTILQMTESEDKATAVVKHSTPNLDSVVPEILSALFTSVMGDKNENELEKVLAEKIDRGVPVKVEEKTYNLVKENDDWKVVLNWKTERQLRKQKDASLVANNKVQWKSSIQIDEMTDEKVATLSSPTIKGADFKSTPYSITIRCKSNQSNIDIELGWGQQINTTNSDMLQFRFDREKMFELKANNQGSTSSSYLVRQADKKKIISLMQTRQIMRVKHSASQVARFSLRGFNSAFQDACLND